jgi:hypothetical protein
MRINVTGFTGAQRGNKTANRKGVLNFSELIIEILQDCGYEAGFQLENPDFNIVFVIDPSSINAGNANEAIPLLAKEPCLIAFDDWNIRGLYKTLDKIVETGKFSKTHHTVDWKIIDEYKDVIKKLADGEFPVIYPAHKAGDHSLIGIRGEATYVDPTIYMADKRTFNPEHLKYRDYMELMPVHASLANMWSELKNLKYSFLNIKNAKEDEVFEYYSKYRMVLSPKHYNSETGWWRGRYIMANQAKAIIVDDVDSIFGNSFEVKPNQINKGNIEGVLALQEKQLYEHMMTKEEVKETMIKIVEDFREKYLNV